MAPTDKAPSGTHKPDLGIEHGTVKGGSCGGNGGCGADNIKPTNVGKK